jgi:hypothetical protein
VREGTGGGGGRAEESAACEYAHCVTTHWPAAVFNLHLADERRGSDVTTGQETEKGKKRLASQQGIADSLLLVSSLYYLFI